MSEIDEGLEEIGRKFLMFLDFHEVSGARWQEMKQAILDLMCEKRGCEPKMTYTAEVMEGPCKWCGKEQP